MSLCLLQAQQGWIILTLKDDDMNRGHVTCERQEKHVQPEGKRPVRISNMEMSVEEIG